MNKILVSVYVLSLELQYDVLIPINITVDEATQLIQNGIVDLIGDSYAVDSDASLYNEEGKVINHKNIVKFSGLKNGSRVLLV